jgi:aminocarboxymuconate-semialdehyde decarboxylase
MMGLERMPNYMMPWTVGMPAETQLSLVALILSGAFDRLPSTLRICFAHGGGSFSFLLGRLENAWHHHRVARGACQFPPRHYLNRFYVDSVVFDEPTLQFLVCTMSAERVLLGSDYPFPLGEEHVGALIRESHLSGRAKAQLLGGNARQFLRLELGADAGGGNDVSTRGGGPSDGHSEQLSYSSYLEVAELLGLQHPQSSPPHHDELLFIIVHQTYELWFKELLHDLDAVVANLQRASAHPESRDEVYEAARLLRFRELEFLCGLKDAKMLAYHKPTPEAHRRLERRLREPSLPQVFFEALRAMGTLSAPQPGASEEQEFETRSRAILSLYKNEQHYRYWIDVCERLTEFDELVVSWRLRHIQLVERIIGIRMGTGGSAGASYLKHTLDKKFFPELWEARTLLTE